MNINDILNMMEDMLEGSLSIPLSGGKCMVNAERFHELIEDARENIPSEISQAQLVVSQRKVILDDAKREAETMIKVAEERARRLVDENEITKQAKEKAKEMLTTAQTQSRELKRAANEYADNLLKNTEQSLMEAVTQLRTAKAALRAPSASQKARPAQQEE